MCVVYTCTALRLELLVDRVLLTLAPILAIIDFDNFMNKVKQAEGIANNHSHEPANKSENC